MLAPADYHSFLDKTRSQRPAEFPSGLARADYHSGIKRQARGLLYFRVDNIHEAKKSFKRLTFSSRHLSLSKGGHGKDFLPNISL